MPNIAISLLLNHTYRYFSSDIVPQHMLIRKHNPKRESLCILHIHILSCLFFSFLSFQTTIPLHIVSLSYYPLMRCSCHIIFGQSFHVLSSCHFSFRVPTQLGYPQGGPPRNETTATVAMFIFPGDHHEFSSLSFHLFMCISAQRYRSYRSHSILHIRSIPPKSYDHCQYPATGLN